MKHILRSSNFAIALLGVALIMTSCKKEGSVDNPTTPVTTSSKIKKVAGDGSEMEFNYNAAGKLQSVVAKDDFVTGGDQTTYTITYGAGDKISELRGSDQSRILPQYTGDNITSAVTKDETGETVYTTTYTYENGRLKSALVDAVFGSIMRFDFTIDAAGNNTRTDVTALDGANQFVYNGYTSYQFDSKTNPLYEVRSLLLLFFQAPSKNNIVKEQEHNAQNVLTETVEYTYIYNNNLPKSAAIKKMPVGGNVTNATLSFTYQ